MFRIIPRKLGRLEYICYFLGFILLVGIFTAIFLPVISGDGKDTVSNSLLVLSLIFGSLKIFVMDIPRLRSIGWSPWLAITMLVPALNGIMQILLFVLPKDFYESNVDSLLREIQKSVESKRNK
jgi:uncharacterized membrane protein YhaH (DUF805 family)